MCQHQSTVKRIHTIGWIEKSLGVCLKGRSQFQEKRELGLLWARVFHNHYLEMLLGGQGEGKSHLLVASPNSHKHHFR